MNVPARVAPCGSAAITSTSFATRRRWNVFALISRTILRSGRMTRRTNRERCLPKQGGFETRPASATNLPICALPAAAIRVEIPIAAPAGPEPRTQLLGSGRRRRREKQTDQDGGLRGSHIYAASYFIQLAVPQFTHLPARCMGRHCGCSSVWIEPILTGGKYRIAAFAAVTGHHRFARARHNHRERVTAQIGHFVTAITAAQA